MTAPYARTVCPLHDEHVDPDTGHCDACQRDARLDCPACDGEGEIYTRHPDWGRPWCPDDYIETPCGQCGEGGRSQDGAR